MNMEITIGNNVNMSWTNRKVIAALRAQGRLQGKLIQVQVQSENRLEPE